MALTSANEQLPLTSVVYGSVILSAQTAAIGSTTIVASAPAGLYKIDVNVQRTVAGTSGNLVVNAIYTDDVASETTAVVTVADISAAAASASGILFFENKATANINYSVTLGGTAGSLSYNVYILIERLF